MKKKFNSMGRVAIALVLALSLSLVMAVPVSAAALSNVEVSVMDPEAGVTTAHTVDFTTAAAIPADGKIVITYPGGFDVSGIAVADSSMDGIFTKEIVGQVITLTRSGGTATGGVTTEWIKLGNLTNTQAALDTYTVTVETKDGGDVQIDIGTSAEFTINPGESTEVRVETAADGGGTVVAAQEVISGDSITVFAITRDVYDNFVENVAADTWSLEGITGGVVAGDLVGAGTSATFTGGFVGTAEIRATEAGLTSVDSGTITVTVSPAAQVVMTPETDDTHVAGTDITFTVELQDAAGNHIDFTAVADVIFTGGTGIWGAIALEGDGTITRVYTTSTAVVTNEVLTVTETIATPAGDQADTSTITTLPGEATQVLVETLANGSGTVVAAQNVVSGNAITVYAITRDANDNFVENVAADAWSLEGITGGVVAGDLAAVGDMKSAIFTGGLVGTAEIRATEAGLTSVDSGTITVIVSPATQVLVETVADGSGDVVTAQNIVSGNAITVYAITRDAGGNFIENVVADAWSLEGITGDVVAGDLVASGDMKSAIFTGGLVGTAEIRATEAGLTSVDSGTITVTAGEKAALAFVDQPTETAATDIITPAVTVEIVDANGNRTSDTDEITIAIDTNPGPGTLLGTLTVAAIDGLATFSDLSIDEMGVGYTLEATSGVLTPDTSAAFNITVGPAVALAFDWQPIETVATETIAVAVTVEIVDAGGNRVTTATDLIAIAILANPGGGTLSGTTPVAAIDGLATFADLSIDKVGVGYTLEATSGTLDPATSDAFNITLGPKAALAFVDEPTETVAGEAISAVTVEIVDAGGNRVTTAIDEITIAIDTNPGPGTLSGTVTVAAEAGLATFDGLSIDKTGVGYDLVAASGALTPDTSAAFDIIPGAVFQIIVTADPGEILADESSTSAITATVTDQCGNNVADGTDVSFGTTRGLVDPVTALTSSGVATTELTAGYASGTATVTATAGGESGSATVKFIAEEIAGITISLNPESIPADGAGTLTITVTLVDEHGNTTPTTGTTVYLETTAGTLDPGSGPTEAGVFTSTLTSSTTPGAVTVAVKVGGVYKGSVTVYFYPLPEPVPPPNQIGLQIGWNAISLPLIPDEPSIEMVLAAVLADVEVVWAYDPVSRPLDPWFSYIPDPEAPIDLTKMEDGLGYWVKMTGDAILTINGVGQPEPPQLPKTYPVVKGWNFIGFKSLHPMGYDDYLVSIAGDYAVILGYSDGDFYNVHPIKPPPDLMPGSGYWIWMELASTIVTLD